MCSSANLLPASPELDLVARVHELTDGLGVDHAFVCADPHATVGTALRATTVGGGVVVTAAPTEAAFEFPTPDVASRQKTLMGSVYGSYSQRHGIPRALDLYRAGQLDLDALITKTYRLDQVNEGLADLREGRVLRGMLRLD